jgi:polyphenol oxidase
MISAPALELPHVSHGFFTREGGHSKGIFASLNCGLGSADDLETAKKNRAIVADKLGVAPTHLLSAHQVHSADVLHVKEVWNERPKVDGLVTDRKGIGLGILTADCGPLLFADDSAGVIGACHSGWKGAVGGVAGNTIAAMEKLGARRGRIIAVLGPTISKANYEVGPEFPKPFLAQDESNQRFFTPSTKPAHFMFDLPAYLMARLSLEGLKTVHDLALCTYADALRFYSYRRTTHRGEPDYGRLISAIALT